MLTFSQLSKNPGGKGSGDIYARGQTLLHLKSRIHLAMKNDGVRIVGIYKHDTDYYIHTKIKSETVDVWYDTVLNLVYHKEVKGKTIADYYVKIFSNMPSFAYFYNYVNHSNGMSISFLKDKLPDIFYEQAPSTRNPDERMGFEKSLMYTAMFITEVKLHWISNLDSKALKLTNVSVIYNKIARFEAIMNKRSSLEKLTRKLDTKVDKTDSIKAIKRNSGFNKPTNNALKPKSSKSPKAKKGKR